MTAINWLLIIAKIAASAFVIYGAQRTHSLLATEVQYGSVGDHWRSMARAGGELIAALGVIVMVWL